MISYIPFRSRYSQYNPSEYSFSKKSSSETDWSHITGYDGNSDARNIIWKKSTHHLQIYQKKYESKSQISLIFCIINENGDDFRENSSDTSRKEWKISSTQTLSQIAQHQKIPHQILNFNSIEELCETLYKRKIQRKMIFIFSNHSIHISQKNIKKIAQINECVWIKSYHGFEKNPHKNILFSGKIFNIRKQKSYLEALKEQENSEKNTLKKLKIPLIITEITIPIERTLYHFFKYQYE